MDNKSLNQNFHEELVDLERSRERMIQNLENEIMPDEFEKVDKSAFNQTCQSFENELLLSKHISALNQQEVDVIQSLLDEGMVNNQFRTVYLLKKDQSPSFFRDCVYYFFHDARAVIQNLSTTLKSSSSAVDFDFLNMHCDKLKESSSYIGACTLVNGCSIFTQAVEKKSKNECVQAVRNLKQVYHDLHTKLERFMELEKEIVLAEEGALGLQ